MSRITISNLETAETSLQQLTATELDATKGGGLLSTGDVNILSTTGNSGDDNDVIDALNGDIDLLGGGLPLPL